MKKVHRVSATCLQRVSYNLLPFGARRPRPLGLRLILQSDQQAPDARVPVTGALLAALPTTLILTSGTLPSTTGGPSSPPRHEGHNGMARRLLELRTHEVDAVEAEARETLLRFFRFCFIVALWPARRQVPARPGKARPRCASKLAGSMRRSRQPLRISRCHRSTSLASMT